MNKRRLHTPTLISVAVCGVLVMMGIVRVMSYSRGALLGDIARGALFSWLAYQPSSYLNAQFFKIFATPSAVAGVYFLIRLRNSSYRRMSPDSYETHGGKIDFASPWLRLILTSVVSFHWAVMELIKYRAEDFYPFSSLESPLVNALVLLVGQVVAFWGMKFLSFEPLLRNDASR
jgi:hypothetical protein